MCIQEHKKIKLVQASTIACSSSAMLEQRGSTRSTRSSRLARQSRTCRVESRRAKWNLDLSQHLIAQRNVFTVLIYTLLLYCINNLRVLHVIYDLFFVLFFLPFRCVCICPCVTSYSVSNVPISCFGLLCAAYFWAYIC